MGVRIDEARVALALEAAGLTLGGDALDALYAIVNAPDALSPVSALRAAGVGADALAGSPVSALRAAGVGADALAGLAALGIVETSRDEGKRSVTLTPWGASACGVRIEERWRAEIVQGRRRRRRRWRAALQWVTRPGVVLRDSRPAGDRRVSRSMSLPEWLALLQVDPAPGPVEDAEDAEEFLLRNVTTETGQLAVDPETGRVLESPLILLGGPVRAPKARGWGKPNRTAKPVKVTRKERRRALAGAGGF